MNCVKLYSDDRLNILIFIKMIIKKKDLKKGDFNIISTEFLKLKISKIIFFTN